MTSFAHRIAVPLLALATVSLPAPAVAGPPGPEPRPPTEAVFSAALTVDVVSYAENLSAESEVDKEEAEARAKLTGTMTTVRFAGGRLVGSTGGAVGGTARASIVEVTDDGGLTETCEGGPLRTVGVPPSLVPVQGRAVFSPFHAAVVDLDCTFSDGGPGGPGRYDLPDPTFDLDIPADIMTRNKVSWSRRYSVTYEVGTEGTCPRSRDDGPRTLCQYLVRTRLDLTRVNGNGGGDGRPGCRAPSGTRLAARQESLRTTLRCDQPTTATVTVRPRRGSSRVLARRQVGLTAHRILRLTVALPVRERAAVRRGEGVRVEVEYRARGWSRRFTVAVPT